MKNNEVSIKKKILFLLKNHWTSPMKLFLIYILFIIIGGCLLYLPISLENGYWRYSPVIDQYKVYEKTGAFTFLDALFLAGSAFTNTGLSVTDVSYTFSFFGEFILFIWIQIGGFGLLSLFYLIGKALNRIFNDKFINNPMVGFVERGGSKISNNGKMLRHIFFAILIIQLVFALIFSFFICFYDFNDVWKMTPKEAIDTDYISAVVVRDPNTHHIDGYHNYRVAFWKSLFLSCSSINNAGFDLFGSFSISIFRNDVGIIMQLLILILFIIGGVGYVCIYDIHRIIHVKFWNRFGKLHKKIYKRNFVYSNNDNKLSITTKVCLWAALIIGLLSIIVTVFTEYVSAKYNGNVNTTIVSDYSTNTYFNGNWFNTNFALFFNALSTRSAGYSTINCNQLQVATKWIFIVLMFIGTSPSSTGGGIRTTTLVISLKSFSQKITNIDNPKLFKRRIPKRMVIESFQIIAIAISMILLFSIISSLVNDFESSFSKVVFEMASAFGTAGLSTGITNEFSNFSLVLIIILMFIGQLGITNTLTVFNGKYTKGKVNGYPNIEIKVG